MVLRNGRSMAGVSNVSGVSRGASGKCVGGLCVGFRPATATNKLYPGISAWA